MIAINYHTLYYRHAEGRPYTEPDAAILRSFLRDGTAHVDDYTLHEARTISASLRRIAEVFVDEGFFLLPDIDCGTSVLHEELVSERIQVTTFFDQDGAPTRTQVTVNFTAELINLTTGETFRDTVVGLDTFGLVTGQEIFVGPGLKILVPGEGVVLLHNGRKIFDADGELIFNAGPDDIFELGLFGGLCAALG